MIWLLAALTCSITIESGIVSGTCPGVSTPPSTPTPTPVPPPAPQPTPAPSYQPPAGVRQMLSEGSNHQESQTLAKPGTTLSWVLPASAGSINFASMPYYTASGMELEVSISSVPGDFESYKHNLVYGTTPCGFRTGQVDATIRWAPQRSFLECVVQGQAYLNIRYHDTLGRCLPAGCGVTFGWHRS